MRSLSFTRALSFAAGPLAALGLLVFGLVAATNGFSNDGFTNTQDTGSTVSAVGPIAIFGGGYGVSYQWLRASATAFLPMTSSSSPVDYGPGFMLTVGVNLDLGWRRRDEPQAPLPSE
jgi:hypothetical protein